MELTNVPMFGLIRRRMAWLSQRQEVLAQNIANADTPKYQSHDLKPFKAKEEIQTGPSQFRIQVAMTNPMHIAGPRQGTGPFRETKERRPYETAPDGNAVVLEEQMVKMDQNATNHRLVNELYRKQLSMFKRVLTSGRGGA